MNLGQLKTIAKNEGMSDDVELSVMCRDVDGEDELQKPSDTDVKEMRLLVEGS